ncbi:MAG TPA: hypothetical protein VF803_03225 [Candidatus Paceibacterota bacterium]
MLQTTTAVAGPSHTHGHTSSTKGSHNEIHHPLKEVLGQQRLIMVDYGLVLDATPEDEYYKRLFKKMLDETRNTWLEMGYTPSIDPRIDSDEFPIFGTGIKMFETKPIFDFARHTFDELEAKMTDGWKPAPPECILAFGAQHPEVQRRFTIVGTGKPTGTVKHQPRTPHVLCLRGGVMMRIERIGSVGARNNYALLAVRETALK